jgi:cytoskeletal protein CcmA (bactofilin family)
MASDATSTIGRGTTVRGNLHGDGDLEILGRIEGSVSVTGELSIGESALIKSDVRGRRVTVRGAIAGNVSATEAIVLEPGARVVGDLGAPQIGIRPGALLRGMVSTGATPAATAAPARAARATPAPAAARAPARPVPKPAPVPRIEPRAPEPVAVAAPPLEPKEAVVHHEEASQALREASLASRTAERGGPPPPVVPQIRKGAKASLKRKSVR